MFSSFPKSYEEVIEWEWEQFQPFAENLEQRELTADSLNEWMSDWTRLDAMIQELYARLWVAETVDTTDEKAIERFENFMSNIYPSAQVAFHFLESKLLESGLEPENFAVPLRNIRTEFELFRESNLPLETGISKLNTAYDKIIGAQTVIWDGKEVTLAQLQPVMLENDRSRREKAFRVGLERRVQDHAKLDELWTKFMDIRKQIAANADCANYRDYQWRKMKRFDYTPEDAMSFFKAIEDVVVPAAERIYEKRRQQMGVDSLRPWDLSVDPLGRSPLKPFKDVSELEEKSQAIFESVAPALGNYIKIMRDENLLDLDNRKGKAPGGYCTDFVVAQRPFIFMNSVGLHDDVQTMLHESGHCFHAFEVMKLPYSQQWQAPMEFNEVASMAMELLAAPYITEDQGGFYDAQEAARARIEHLESNILFWPYMAVVASFQHWVYTNHEEATIAENCDRHWVELWNRFMKGIDFSGLEDAVKNRWRRQLHIFQVPFYYIEYGLAQLGAVQVWANSLNDQAGALDSYLKALALGNTVTLPELYETAGAKLAFDAETLKQAVDLMEKTISELEATSS